MRQMEPHVKWHFFGRKVLLSISDVPKRFKVSVSRFPANFKKISESHIFDLSCDQAPDRVKLAIFKTCSDLLNMGRVCLVLMPVVTLLSFVTFGRLKVG